MAEDTETLRNDWRPGRVRFLFVGESPPASGRYFYREDSNLFRATREAFDEAGVVTPGRSFLASFRDSECWLWDLSPDPINRWQEPDREAAASSGVPGLIQLLREVQPEAVIVVIKRIEKHVRQAILDSGLKPEILVLPFPRLNPGRSSEPDEIYRRQLARFMKTHISRTGAADDRRV